MKLSDFDYELPKELIAQEPATPRDSSRLMVLDRKKQTIEHKIFSDLVDFLNEEDLLVINNAKVFPARLLGEKENTGGKIDLLLVEEVKSGLPHSRWKCLIRGSGKIKKGLRITFGEGKLNGAIIDYDKGLYLVDFALNQSAISARQRFNGGDSAADGSGFNEILEEIGEMPLPPYIKNASESSKKKYQTVYAKRTGAIAAPTAGFHFTEGLLGTLKDKGVSFATLTLIVGRGTFNPVKTENVEDHFMDEEYFEIEEGEKEKINAHLKNKKRIVAVGTTTVRTLESAIAPANSFLSRQFVLPRQSPMAGEAEVAGENGEITLTKGKTSLFIYPGYKFNTINAFVTNFHLPKSTPLLLTCAFGGRELILRAYREAIEKKYRFYSFGDAMLII